MKRYNGSVAKCAKFPRMRNLSQLSMWRLSNKESKDSKHKTSNSEAVEPRAEDQVDAQDEGALYNCYLVSLVFVLRTNKFSE